MRITRSEVGRFAGYMFVGLIGFFLLGGLTPVVFVVAMLFVVVIVVASAVCLGKD